VAGLDTSAALYLLGQRLGDAAQTYVPELVALGVLGHVLLGEGHALGDGDEAPLLAVVGAFGEDVCYLVEVGLDLGDEGDVGGGGEAGAPGDPTGVPPHHLHDHYPLVALGGRPELVYGVRGDGDRRVEPERRIRRREVVVYGLRAPDDLHAEVVV
jgi:hypothetical protein